MSKYGAVPTIVDNIRFASKREAERYEELKGLQNRGLIKDLRWQVRWPLHATRWVHGDRVQVAVYVADFVYRLAGEGPGTLPTVEDVKGYRTQLYNLKKRWLKAEYGIDIQEIY